MVYFYQISTIKVVLKQKQPKYKISWPMNTMFGESGLPLSSLNIVPSIPLYTILRAWNTTQINILSLECSNGFAELKV